MDKEFECLEFVFFLSIVCQSVVGYEINTKYLIFVFFEISPRTTICHCISPALSLTVCNCRYRKIQEIDFLFNLEQTFDSFRQILKMVFTFVYFKHYMYTCYLTYLLWGLHVHHVHYMSQLYFYRKYQH